MKRYLFLLLIIPVIFSCNHQSEGTYDNYVVLVSFDGCRWDYPDLYDLTNFKALGEDGVQAERVISSFPTKTFPNHYSIATGLYPDHHGLINNTFFAPDLGLRYSIGNREMVQNPDFYEGEPIWNTAEEQGMISASFFWVGSEAPIGGIQPAYWKKYDGSIPFMARVDSVINWLSLPLEERPRLVLLYFQEPDGVGHDFGPVNEETGDMMQELDLVLASLRQKLASLPYGDRINLIVTSDHGMGAIDSSRYVNILQWIEPEWLDNYYGSNPMYLLDAADGFADTLASVLNANEGVTAWKKSEIPARLNYGTHSRVTDVVAVADSSWSIGVKTEAGGYTGGAHGYDNRNTDMHNIFYAVGPDFKKGYSHGVIENVDIYPLIAEILGLEPAETDGKLEDVEGMLVR